MPRAYDSSEAGKAAHKRYRQSEAGKAARSKYRKSAIGKVAAARYRAGEAGRLARRRQQLLRAKNHPEKTKAGNDVRHAIERGELIRQPCLICGVENTQAHHPDYSKPLHVEWLCRAHHGERHQLQ
jgi:hypothetical protein